MEWFRKHTDAVMVISTIFCSMIWMNGKFNDIEKDVAVIKAVLIIKGIMPHEIAVEKHENP